MTTNPPQPSRFTQFVAELKRRHIVRFSLGYAAAAFVVLQLAEIIFPAFQIGETGLRILVVAVALLFPPAVVLAWIFDVTSSGVERTANEGGRRNRLLPGLALLGLTVTIVGAVGVWLAQEGVLDRPQTTQERRRAGQANEPILVAYDPDAPIRSLAVLPLDDFSDGGPADYFTMGMQEELIAQLSQLAGLRVVSRTSVQRYAGTDIPIPRIGQDLRVDAIIEGSVRRMDNQVRITVQLIHAPSDTHIWTQQYDRDLENLLALQSEVALDIARQIQAEVTPEETTLLKQVASRTVDPEAQDAYLRGRYEAEKGTPEALESAKNLFEVAVAEDSSFAPALAGLAGTRFLLGLADSAVAVADLALAEKEAQKALEIDAGSKEAQEVLTFIRQVMPSPPRPGAPGTATAGAASPGEVARSMPGRGGGTVQAPSTPDSAWFQAMTHLGRQIEVRLRSHTGDPERAPDVARFVGARQLMAAGLFEEAVGILADLVDEGVATPLTWELLARGEMALGDPEAAVEAMEAWHATGGEEAPTTAEVRALSDAVDAGGATGFWRWTLGRMEAGGAAGRRVSPTDLAAARAGSGNVEGAFQALEAAVRQRDRGLISLQKDPVWDVLRKDARFAEFVRRSRDALSEAGGRGPGGPRRDG